MNNTIVIEKLNKSFENRKIVSNLSLNLPGGKICGFLGPNGSGKTTSIRMICGLITPDSGKGTCLGYDIYKDREKIKRKIGYMTQRFSLWGELSVLENIQFIARLHSIPYEQQRSKEVIHKMGLEKYSNHQAKHLSGGWKQRLALAATLLHSPEILLLDEPTAGVDPNSRREFWQILHQLSDEGLTILVSTHYMDEAERCHYIAYLVYGELLTFGKLCDVMNYRYISTFAIKGDRLSILEKSLIQHPAIAITTLFGNVLRVTGEEKESLCRALDNIPKNFSYEEVDSSLDDILSLLLKKKLDKK